MIPPDLKLFCALDLDRRQALEALLVQRQLNFLALDIRGHRHFLVKGPGQKLTQVRKLLVAHYDRKPGTPGANDNTASVFHLLNLAQGLQKRWPEDLALAFTDGEELESHQDPHQQGACGLGNLLKAQGLGGVFPVVLDMCGRGDTLVLGRGSEALVSGPEKVSGEDLLHRLEFHRLHARKMIHAGGFGSFVEVVTPFSDDLGFLLAGIPAVQISLLPRKEALAYQRQAPGEGPFPPPAWQTMHTPQDTPMTLDPQSFPLMQKFLQGVLRYPLPVY